MNSLPAMVRQVSAAYASQPCFLLKVKDGLQPTTYGELGQAVEQCAAGLVAAGVAPGERVVMVSENCPEWVVADSAILTAGAINVPLYPSLPAEQLAPLIQRVRARVVIVEDARQLAKLEGVRDELPTVEQVLVFKGDKLPPEHALARPWQELQTAGQAALPALQPELDARVAALRREDVATIIFTSGTTGVPKGAMLTHGNLLHNVEITQDRIRIEASDRFVVFLPLCHVFQRMVLYLGLATGASALFNENLRALLPNLRVVRPTIMIVVPRFLELVRERISESVAQRTGLARKVADWAMGVAEEIGLARQAGREPSPWLRLKQRVAERRVFGPIRELMGLDQLRFMVSGGAALPVDVGRWFWGLGLKVAQGYGLTETSPVVAVNDPDGDFRFDSIGPPAKDIEVKLAEDGELLVRGGCVMAGYFEMPEETAAAIDPEGWFHTGDIGTWTPEQHLRITDRKKNIMVLANGKNVAPAPLEARLQESPLIAQAVLIGDGQNVVTALLVPRFEALRQALEQAGEPVSEPAAMAASKAAEKLVRAEISRLSGDLATFEMVRKFKLLPTEFSVERGELTPTMKVVRRVVLDHYADLVQEMAE